MRRFVTIAGVITWLAFVAGPSAFALEEQKAPAPAQSEPAPKPGLQDGAAAAKADDGTEIRIPGLGKLGTLPKMDFGLELLYGAAEGKAPDAPPPDSRDPNDDLMIRGSVKHRF